jgi:succinate-acetate transporter protein
MALVARPGTHGRPASYLPRVMASGHHVTEEAMADEVRPVNIPIADPAPLGLAGFALTTFLLSAANARWMSHATGGAFLGYAFAYGGLCQLLAGMWEFRNKNVFGATAFSTYGGFWIGLGLWFELVATKAPAAAAAAVNHDVGWILVAFAIFNTYMLILSTQVTLAVFGVFLTLEATEIIDAIGKFYQGTAAYTGILEVGGYVGIVTAVLAWYTSAAGVSNGITAGRLRFPVGRPLLAPAAPAAELAYTP